MTRSAGPVGNLSLCQERVTQSDDRYMFAVTGAVPGPAAAVRLPDRAGAGPDPGRGETSWRAGRTTADRA
ncbi:hypothetical protein JCM9957A_34140 [Kineosporia succinea]